MSKRIPGATYRLQFNRDFTFSQAHRIAAYLRELGITDCYASPIFKAAPQSTHGYDGCDFTQLNPDLGSIEDFEQFVSHIRGLGMNLLLDFVPNHMSTHSSNSWWFDVLEKGPTSKHARWFDIDWQKFEGGKVLLPILEDEYERVLQAGKLRLVYESEKPFIAYYDRRLPLSPESAARISNQISARGIDSVLAALNGIPGTPESFAGLNALLQQQHYLLAYWQTGLREINYRRFFDINELVSLRIELPDVFDAAHHLVLSLLKDGQAAGLRIDHPDGLWDPKKYLSLLRGKARDAYLVVEKILTDDESLPEDWPVEGTTGYDFLNCVNGLFVNQVNTGALDRVYREFTGCHDDIQTMVYETKKRILLNSFPAGIKLLTGQLKRIAAQFTIEKLREALVEIVSAFPVYRTYVDEETPHLSEAETNYVNAALVGAILRLKGSDKELLFIHDLLRLRVPARAGDAAKNMCREFVMRFQQLTGPVMAKGLEDTAFYNFNRLISLNEVGGNPDHFGNSVDDFHRQNIQKSDQWPHSLLATATHDTKRGEDVRARINVLSELPDEWQNAMSRWREINAAKKTMIDGQPAPHPNDECFFYQTLLGAWPTEISTADELTSFRERMVACMLKSIKEAKTHTSWLQPNAAYEAATRNFVEQTLEVSSTKAFLDDFKIFQGKISFFGRLNSLSQVLLKITSPGVPDFYQGTELWDLNLVDPDNRRPVDYEIRRRALDELKNEIEPGPTFHAQLLADLLKDDRIGRSKLYLIWRALEFRNRHRNLFDSGNYVPLTVEGAKKEHICAFARVQGDAMAIVVAPRLFAGLTNGICQLPLGPEFWGDVTLELPGPSADHRFQNILTNEEIGATQHGRDSALPLAQILAHFPIALIERRAETR
jgi:(1->4)-alpha-D-glucan 1-alpha-D-glucosylmutase